MDKETLQKKIESGDTVWTTYWAGELSELNLKEDEETYWEIEDDYLFKCSKLPYLAILRIPIGDVFATREEVEFGNITRTEKLELPTWEQFKKDKCFTFFGIGWTFYELHNRRRNKLQLDYSYDNDYYRPEKEWKLTYENYLEACRLCKKLFLGEEL